MDQWFCHGTLKRGARSGLHVVTEHWQSLQNCWRKADYPPGCFKEQLCEEAVRSLFVPKLDEEDSDDLFEMIEKPKVGGPAVKGSFCDDREPYTESGELRKAAEAWVSQEDASARDMCNATQSRVDCTCYWRRNLTLSRSATCSLRLAATPDTPMTSRSASGAHWQRRH